MADGETRGAAGEAAVSDQRARLAEAHGFQIGGGIEHLLHARAAFGPFVADHHHLASLHSAIQDAGDRRVLALEHPGRATEGEVLVIHPGGLDDGAIEGQVAGEHRQAPFQAVGVVERTDAALGPIQIQLGPAAALAECLGGANTGRAGAIEVVHRLVVAAADVIGL